MTWRSPPRSPPRRDGGGSPAAEREAGEQGGPAAPGRCPARRAGLLDLGVVRRAARAQPRAAARRPGPDAGAGQAGPPGSRPPLSRGARPARDRRPALPGVGGDGQRLPRQRRPAPGRGRHGLGDGAARPGDRLAVSSSPASPTFQPRCSATSGASARRSACWTRPTSSTASRASIHEAGRVLIMKGLYTGYTGNPEEGLQLLSQGLAADRARARSTSGLPHPPQHPAVPRRASANSRRRSGRSSACARSTPATPAAWSW